MINVDIVILTLLDNTKLYIVAQNISSFVPYESEFKYTIIVMNNRHQFDIWETPEQILAQL